VRLNTRAERLRLIGMDTPETVDPRKPVQCFGREASNRAKAVLTGQSVQFEADGSQDERDRYGRLLRYV
jgi:micrococcal nuclease